MPQLGVENDESRPPPIGSLLNLDLAYALRSSEGHADDRLSALPAGPGTAGGVRGAVWLAVRFARPAPQLSSLSERAAGSARSQQDAHGAGWRGTAGAGAEPCGPAPAI